MRLADLFDPAEMAAMIEGGFLRSQTSDDGRYRILNYTDHAQFDGVWNATTLTCRGLIVDDETGDIAARPFPKFFNLDEHARESVPDLQSDGPVHVTDKLDGSLGILYRHGGEPRIATRGSFNSDQAVHASAVWNERHASPKPDWDVTYLFEIIYPKNRIVVDYGDRDELVLLGANVIETGQFIPPEKLGWNGAVAETFPYRTLTEAIAAPDRPGREGLVVHFEWSGQRVKIKQEDYVLLHRLITGLTERTVWELVASGTPLAEILLPLPEEFHPWGTEVYYRLCDQYADLELDIESFTREALKLHDPKTDRKGFAIWVTQNAGPLSGFIFSTVDGKDTTAKKWATLRPDPIPATNGGVE